MPYSVYPSVLCACLSHLSLEKTPEGEARPQESPQNCLKCQVPISSKFIFVWTKM